jgi:2-oxoglutarate ferredoxin oxidoreductase subunit delta
MIAKAATEYTIDNPPVLIRVEWCKACGICYALCPQGVLAGDDFGVAVVVKPEACTQCAICWLHCPDFAITSAGDDENE